MRFLSVLVVLSCLICSKSYAADVNFNISLFNTPLNPSINPTQLPYYDIVLGGQKTVNQVNLVLKNELRPNEEDNITLNNTECIGSCTYKLPSACFNFINKAYYSNFGGAVQLSGIIVNTINPNNGNIQSQIQNLTCTGYVY